MFIRNGELRDNRVEDPAGWYFTRSGDAYAAIRVAGDGYDTTSLNEQWVDRKVISSVEQHGSFFKLKDMWSPVVIQMGRAADYTGSEAFHASVKENPFTYQDCKPSYVSEAKVTYEYLSHSNILPKINGKPVNLNLKTYDSPFLAMLHGTNKAVIRYKGYDDLVLEF